ncbi:MAG: DUF2520 domain-containing protein [Alistipes sp.]|nr:DUF2520 domain-containing protein [Alistipes sp.]
MESRLGVVVVGSGNVAEAVAIAVGECPELELRQVVARNAERVAEVARLAGSGWCADLSQAADADLYIIAVSDRAVGEVALRLRRRVGSVVVHTAGSVEQSVLGDEGCGVLYPFQTFTAGRRVDFSAVPLFVEGVDEPTTLFVERVAKMLSRRVYRATSAVRREVHLTGVLSCNFVNSLYAMAADRLNEYADLPFDVLRPLIEETARKAVDANHPRRVQTGPAVRGDRSVAERHEAMLEGEKEKQIYKLLTEYIWQTSKKI